MIKKICIFGDSIAFGSDDLEFGGWQNHLKVWFAKRGKFQHVFNLAISGRTSNDIVKRFKDELLARKNSHPDSEMLAVVAIPSNNVRFLVIDRKIKMEITEDVFKKNLRKIKMLADKYADKLVFVGITKVVDKKTNPWYLSSNGHSWKNEFIKKYNKILKEFCQKEKIHFIEMFDLLEDEDLPDGLHPNTEGHKKMFLRIKEFLVKEGIVE